MSRILISTMVVGVLTTLGSSTGVAQSLNINPYPAEKAGTLSSSGPDLYEPEPVEVFAKEMEEDVLMIERQRTLEVQEKAERLRLKKQSEAYRLPAV